MKSMSHLKRWASGVFEAAVVVLTMIIVNGVACDAQVTNNVFLRVLMIKTVKGQATGLTIDVDGRQYLITAKHVVAGLQGEGNVQIRKIDTAGKIDNWDSFRMKIFTCDDPVDIAVLVPPSQLTVTFPLEPTTSGIQYGQDMFFVGFPFGMYSTNRGLGIQYPVGLVKKGVMSGLINDDTSGVKILLDGYNIFGFSGAPIVYRDLGRTDVVYKVAGVVSGFQVDLGTVLRPKEIRPQDVTADDKAEGRIVKQNGHTFRLDDTPEMVKLNTGIVTAYGIPHALDLIHQHPIGPKVVDNFKE